MEDYMEEVPEDDLFAPPEEDMGASSRRSATGGAPVLDSPPPSSRNTSTGRAAAHAGKESDEDVPFVEEEVIDEDEPGNVDAAPSSARERDAVNAGKEEDVPFVEEAVADDEDEPAVTPHVGAAVSAGDRAHEPPPPSTAAVETSRDVGVEEEVKEDVLDAAVVADDGVQRLTPSPRLPDPVAEPVNTEVSTSASIPAAHVESAATAADVEESEPSAPPVAEANEAPSTSRTGSPTAAIVEQAVNVEQANAPPPDAAFVSDVAALPPAVTAVVNVEESRSPPSLPLLHVDGMPLAAPAATATGETRDVDEYAVDDDFESAAVALDEPEPFSARTREALEPLKALERPPPTLQPTMEEEETVAAAAPAAVQVPPSPSTAVEEQVPVDEEPELQARAEGLYVKRLRLVVPSAAAVAVEPEPSAQPEPAPVEETAAHGEEEVERTPTPLPQAPTTIRVELPEPPPVAAPEPPSVAVPEPVLETEPEVVQEGDAIFVKRLQLRIPYGPAPAPPPVPPVQVVAPPAAPVSVQLEPRVVSTSTVSSPPVAWVMHTPARSPAPSPPRAAAAQPEPPLPSPSHSTPPAALDLSSLATVLQHYARPLHALFLHVAWRNGRPTPPTTTSFETVAIPTLDKGGFIAISLALGLPVPRSTTLDAYVSVQRSHGVQVLIEEHFHIALTRLATGVGVAIGANVTPPVALHACLHPTCGRAAGVEKRVRNGSFGFKSGQRLSATTLWEIMEPYHDASPAAAAAASEAQPTSPQRDAIDEALTAATSKARPSPQRGAPGGTRSPSRVILPTLPPPPAAAAIPPAAPSLSISAPVAGVHTHVELSLGVPHPHAVTAPTVVPVPTPVSSSDGGWAALALSAGGVTLHVEGGYTSMPSASPNMALSGGALAGLEFHASPAPVVPSSTAVYEFESLLGTGAGATPALPGPGPSHSVHSPVRRGVPAPSPAAPTLARAGARVIQPPVTTYSGKHATGGGGSAATRGVRAM